MSLFSSPQLVPPNVNASPLSGLQPNAVLGADLAAMPDPRRQAMLRSLGIQQDDPGAQVTGNWTQSVPMPPVPNTSAAASPPPMPQQPQSVTNPPVTPGAAGSSTPPMPPMPTFGGNSGNVIRGPMPPMPAGSPLVAAPGGGVVPQSSPLAVLAQQQGGSFGGMTSPGSIAAAAAGAVQFANG